ncbi:MAG: TIGR03435 family protein [Acidobacteriia bacterium]|nr:TIGR03435 family protein [Terriglobia bacterium]
MRKLMLWMIGFAVSSGGALLAQNITGSWQGTLQSPQGRPPLRIVIKITRADDESLKAVLYSIDQGGQPINASSISQQGSNMKMAVAGIGGDYEGRLIGDGNTIAGTWTQGGPAMPLNLTRSTPETAWAIPEPPPPPKPMAADANPSFEVATIKPSNPDTPGQSILVGRGGTNLFTTTNTTLNDLITFAYGVHLRQVTGGPGWLETEKYDITAKPDQAGIPNATQVRTMLQKLLAERFHLTFHRDKKELAAYTITVAKTGPKLAKNETGGMLPGFGGRGPGNIAVRNSTMEEFAGFLQGRIVDRPVVDQTGLSGKFDFTLLWRPDQLAAPGPNAPPLPADLESRADLFTAIQEQLGLKLEAAKAPVEVLVIDRVEKASEN